MPPPVPLLLTLPPSLPLFLLLCVSFYVFILLALLLIFTRSRRLHAHLKPPVLQHQLLDTNAIPTSDSSSPPSPVPMEAAEEGEKKGGDERKRRKRGRKKKQEHRSPVGDDQTETETGRLVLEMVVAAAEGKAGVVQEDCMYPFSSFSSVTQRRIKQQYDLLVKSNAAKTLSMAQVGQFANCLVEARKDLQHKFEIIHRKFTIKKALLHKADRSSFSRLSEQTCKLETEQKRLLEDALVYNRLQEQLKLSPAFKKLLEVGARMEESKSSKQNMEHIDSETDDISFEELLAQEKKDSFWQRNGKLRTCTG